MITGSNSPVGGDADNRSPKEVAKDLIMEAITRGNTAATQDQGTSEETPETIETATEAYDEAPETGAEEESVSEVEAEAEGDEDTDEEQTGDGDVNIEDLSQLAAAIGVENEWLYNLKIPMPDGQEPITLGQVKDQIREGKLAQVDVDNFTNERQKFEEERAKFETELQQKYAEASQVSDELIQAQARAEAIVLQFQNTDWERLEEADPGQAALQQQKMQTAYQQAQSQVEHARRAQQVYLNESAMNRRNEEEKALLNAVPEWKDVTVRNAESAEVSALMAEYGFRPEEISNVMDHRAIKAMRDLAKLRSAVKTSEEKVEVVRKAPKPLKPAARQPKPSKLKQLEQKLDRAKHSGDRRVKTGAVAELLSSVGVKPR